MMQDSRVPVKNKIYIGAAISYFVSPVDIILDLFPVIGIADDVALANWVLKSLLDSVDEKVIIE